MIEKDAVEEYLPLFPDTDTVRRQDEQETRRILKILDGSHKIRVNPLPHRDYDFRA